MEQADRPCIKGSCAMSPPPAPGDGDDPERTSPLFVREGSSPSPAKVRSHFPVTITANCERYEAPAAAAIAWDAAAGSSAPKTADPATKTEAPAAATDPAVFTSTPPSTSITVSPTIARNRSTLPGDDEMNDCPPQPGLTVMQRTMSARPRSSESASTGVPGLIAIAAEQPSSRIAERVRLACGVASAWKVIESAPALANSSIWRSGASIIMWTSIAPPASWTRSAIAPATSGPIVIGGTKCPSMMSTWMTRAPASIPSSTCEPSLAKSAERIDGATRGVAVSSRNRSLMRRSLRRFEHGGPAHLAFHVGGVGHAGDRLVFAALGTLGDEFEAAEAVDAAQAAGELGRTQPGLAAVRARGPSQDVGGAGTGLGHRQIVAGRAAGVSPALTESSISFAGKAADEEAGGAVAVGAQLQRAWLVGRGKLRRQGAEIVQFERRRLAGCARFEQRRDPVLVLAPRDRAGRVDEGAARPQQLRRVEERLLLHRGDPLDDPRRFAPARVGARGERAEVRAGRVEEDAVEAFGQWQLGRVALEDGDAVEVEPGRLGGDLGGALLVELDRDDLAPVLHPLRDLTGFDPRAGAEVEHRLPRPRRQRFDHRGRTATLRRQRALPHQLRDQVAEPAGEDHRLGYRERPATAGRRDVDALAP